MKGRDRELTERFTALRSHRRSSGRVSIIARSSSTMMGRA